MHILSVYIFLRVHLVHLQFPTCICLHFFGLHVHFVYLHFPWSTCCLFTSCVFTFSSMYILSVYIFLHAHFVCLHFPPCTFCLLTCPFCPFCFVPLLIDTDIYVLISQSVDYSNLMNKLKCIQLHDKFVSIKHIYQFNFIIYSKRIDQFHDIHKGQYFDKIMNPSVLPGQLMNPHTLSWCWGNTPKIIIIN